MRFVLFSFVLFGISTHITLAQTSTTEDENYKHSNTVHKHNSTTFESDSISLRNQKTQKQHSRKYIVAPSDRLPNRDVQGKKKKGNYKNQFN